MRRGGGKPKGSANERAEAKRLSAWLYNDPNVLVRSEGSGSLATNRKDGLGLGDVQYGKLPPYPCPFVVELKHLKDPVLVGDVLRVKSLFRQAWTQCVRACELTPGSAPLMVFRSNRREPIVSIRAHDADDRFELRLSPRPLRWTDEEGLLVYSMPAATLFTADNAKQIRTWVCDRAG